MKKTKKENIKNIKVLKLDNNEIEYIIVINSLNEFSKHEAQFFN